VIGERTEAHLILAGTSRMFSLVDGQTWAIGRGEGCAVLLDSRSVSRLHALIQRRDSGDYYLVDLGSRNGSFVNGRRVSLPLRLRDGDQIVVAEQELIFHRGTTNLPVFGYEASDRNLPTETLLAPSLTTIVVVDIRDFTPLARTVSEALLSQTIGTWFLRVGQVAERWGSWARQYIGDAVMAVWVHKNASAIGGDLERALRAVCDINLATREVSRTLPLPGPLRIGAGISTGPAVLGGTDYTALGETVNAAFRLEAATKVIGSSVALGQGAYDALGALQARVFRKCEVQLKGYESPATAWATSFEDLERSMGSRTV